LSPSSASPPFCFGLDAAAAPPPSPGGGSVGAT